MKVEILGTGCAKCSRLYEAVSEAAEGLGVSIELEKVEDIGKIVDYGVMMTPGLVIDGKVVLSGRVPPRSEIEALLSQGGER